MPKGFTLLLRLLTLLLVLLMIGCTSPAATETPTAAAVDPLQMIHEAADNIRSANTFRIAVNQSGPDYMLLTDYATVLFRRAVAQYVVPGMMQATIRVVAQGLPIEVDVFSHGSEQWYRAIWTGNRWLNEPFAPDFNPESLLAEDTGIEAALQSLIKLTYVGEETLDSGALVYHLVATANGPDVAALLGNLIAPVGTVEVDVYVDRETHYPVRFIITEYDSPYAVTAEPGEENDPIVWTIDLYDIDAPSEITLPETTADATAEATGEATPDAMMVPPAADANLLTTLEPSP